MLGCSSSISPPGSRQSSRSAERASGSGVRRGLLMVCLSQNVLSLPARRHPSLSFKLDRCHTVARNLRKSLPRRAFPHVARGARRSSQDACNRNPGESSRPAFQSSVSRTMPPMMNPRPLVTLRCRPSFKLAQEARSSLNLERITRRYPTSGPATPNSAQQITGPSQRDAR